MCGIAGLWTLRQDRRFSPQSIAAMTAMLRHRGPDDEGYLAVQTRTGSYRAWGGADTPPDLRLPGVQSHEDNAWDLMFGFRRLSIIDLSPAGHQPMSYADGQLWVVFNGEIYNYVELRAELRQFGYEFRSQSDTEVILAAYHRWGADALRRFNGMFAIALWDGQRQVLFCARDRMGIKPFYYRFDGQGLFFASEIKAILAAAPEARQVDEPYLANFLVTGAMDYDERTPFHDIKALPPAHYVEIRHDTTALKPVRFWDVHPEECAARYDFAHPEATYRDLLADSVRLRLRSDVPVGTCLSGGIDSSSIVMLASGLLPHSINSFSSVYDHPDYSEEPFINVVAQASNARSHFTHPSPDQFFDILPRIVWHMDTPVKGPGVYSQWLVMQLASRHVTVLLDGQGGDELFAGYFSYLLPHLRALWLNLRRRPTQQALMRVAKEGMTIARDARSAYFPELTSEQFIRRVVPHLTGRRHDASQFLAPDLAAAQRNLRVHYHNPISDQDPLNQILYRDTTQTSIPALLHYEDRSSMAFGMEARVPLLDYRIIEFALTLPGDSKIEGSTTKVFPRKAMKGILPEAVRLRRDKKGYPTPLAVWLRGPLRQQADEILDHHFSSRRLYNLATVQRMWREHTEGSADHSWHIVRWLTTEYWFQTFIDDTPTGNPYPANSLQG